MAIQRNKKGKWSIKGSKKFIVYERITDLTKEDAEVLEKYDLKNKVYVYVGQCGAWLIDKRHSKFRWDILNRFLNKKARINPLTAITYQNIFRFFREQKGMTQKQVEDYLFRSEECFHIYMYNIDTVENAELEEQKLYDQLTLDNVTDKSFILLPNSDATIYTEEDNDILRVKAKNENTVVRFETLVEVRNEDLYDFINKNDIIITENRNLDKKNPLMIWKS